MAADHIVKLNIGGTLYTTRVSTLTKYPESRLAKMFEGTEPSTEDSNGNFFIDRDGSIFRFILNYIRTGKLHLPKDFTEYGQLHEEAEFYEITPLSDYLKKLQPIGKPVGGLVLELHEIYNPSKLSKNEIKIIGPIGKKSIKVLLEALPHKLLEDYHRRLKRKDGGSSDVKETRLLYGLILREAGWEYEGATLDSKNNLHVERWYLK